MKMIACFFLFVLLEQLGCCWVWVKAGGVGINLTSANIVIFYDSDWNPAMDRQATDRAHRIGQKREVHIYRLISEHTVEENMWQRQLQKRALDDVVVDQGRFNTEKLMTLHQEQGTTDGADVTVWTAAEVRALMSKDVEVKAPVADSCDGTQVAEEAATEPHSMAEFQAVLQRVEDGQDAQMANEALTEATEAEIMLKGEVHSPRKNETKESSEKMEWLSLPRLVRWGVHRVRLLQVEEALAHRRAMAGRKMGTKRKRGPNELRCKAREVANFASVFVAEDTNHPGLTWLRFSKPLNKSPQLQDVCCSGDREKTFQPEKISQMPQTRLDGILDEVLSLHSTLEPPDDVIAGIRAHNLSLEAHLNDLDSFVHQSRQALQNLAERLRNEHHGDVLWQRGAWHFAKGFCKRLVDSPVFEGVLSVIIFVNAITIGIESDLSISGAEEDLVWASILEVVFLTIYVIELVVRLVAHQWKCFEDYWFLFDFVLVTVSLVGQIMTSFTTSTGFIQQVLVLRALRLLRVIRALRMIKQMRAVWRLEPSTPQVVSAVTGEPIAALENEDFAEASVKALKQRLAQKIGLPRFRLRLFQDNCPMDDDQTLAPQVVQLVILEFLPADAEQDQGIMVACQENDDKLLEQYLNQARNPNFKDAIGITPLHAAASNGSLECVLLLIEAGAQKDTGRTGVGQTPLHAAAQNGHLEVVRFLVESGANKDQARSDIGATPLFAAAENVHLEVVRFLVESGANKDQTRTDIGATPLLIAAVNGHLEVVRLLVESGANQRPSPERYWSNTFVRCCSERTPGSCEVFS
eukprot:symbB.v1.2.000869.t1/scaffold38.1/size396883/9